MNISIDEDLIDKVLTDLGLTRYEAMVYRALIKLGEAKAIDISRESSVPREKTYQVLRILEDKDMVKRIEERPRKWIAMPPTSIFQEIINARKRSIEKIEETINKLQALYEKGSGRTERKDLNIWEISLNTFEESFYSLLNYARYSIECILTPYMVDALFYKLDIFKKLGKKDVNIKILTWLYEDNMHQIAKLGNYTDIYIIPWDPIDISIFIIDDKNGFIIKDRNEYIIQFTDSRVSYILGSLFKKIMRSTIKYSVYLRFWDILETFTNHEILQMNKYVSLIEEYNSRLLSEMVANGGVTIRDSGRIMREILCKYVPDYRSLPLERKAEFINLLLDINPLYNGISIDLDVYNKTLTIEMEILDDRDYIEMFRDNPVDAPLNPLILLIQEEIRGAGWREIQSIWIEDKKPRDPFQNTRLARIIKSYRAPVKEIKI